MYAVVVFPESPRYLYAKGKFAESKNVLAYVAKFNNQPFDKNLVIFDTETAIDDGQDEKRREEEAALDDVTSSNEKERLARSGQYFISNRDFMINLALMCGLFTMMSFSFWLIDF
jgi:hypothetical protein